MVHIKVRNGLDIPIKGKPEGEMRSLTTPKFVALNLSKFRDFKFKLLAKQGDHVKIGQVIADDKSCPGRYFVSPGAGTIKEVVRGLRRRLLYIVIELDQEESYEDFGTLSVESAPKEMLITHMKKSGMFSQIRKRPFNLLANPEETPRDIFVKAIESAPFACPAEHQVLGFEKEFQIGLTALSTLTSGKVHLTYHKKSTLPAFTEAQNVEKHTVEGPHPSSNLSTHIHFIAPIQTVEESVWTLHASDVVCLGVSLSQGKLHIERSLSIAGPGITPQARGFYKGRAGLPIANLIDSKNSKGWIRYISGDPLTGTQVTPEEFLGFQDYTFCALHENEQREFLHFFLPGFHKYSTHRVYGSGFAAKSGKEFDFNTNQHGEHRAFVDSSIFNKVMPMRIPTAELVKSIIAQDFDTAEELGLLEVDGEDFALPTFIDPCKNEMVEIVNEGLHSYAKEVVS